MDPLLQLVQKQRARWMRLQVLEAVGLAVTAVLAYFLVAVLLDNFARLPVLGRWVVAAGLVAAFIQAGRLLWRHWSRRHASEDEIALAMERRSGGVQNRLINALQIGREAKTEVAAAVVQDNWRSLEQLPLSGALNARPAAISSAFALLLVMAVVGGWLWAPNRFATAATRILLPFASIDPLYRTRLDVLPGDVEAVGDVTITVKIRGEQPSEIAVLLDEKDQRSSHIVAVPSGKDTVTYTIPNVQRSLAYAVRGGDFTSPYFRIDVPTPAGLAKVQATYRYPAYTKLPERTVETSGDLEAVQGTQAQVLFLLDHPAESAKLVLRTPAPLGGPAADVVTALERVSETEFKGEIPFAAAVEYRLETQQPNRAPHPTAWHGLRVVVDEPPRLELSGLPATGDVPLETPLPLRVAAIDDFGLTRYGLFVRRSAGTAAEAQPEAWKPVAEWKASGELKASQPAELLAMNLGAAEGERLELVVQGQDAHPSRAGKWTQGQVYSAIVAGEGAQLQILYEQILRSEAEITGLVASQTKLHEKSDQLVRQLDADPAADGNDPAKVKELIDWSATQTKDQGQLRETTARVAKAMPAPAGNLRLSLGMLADTEMIRVLRVLESVATRDDAAGRRTAFTEARATQQRTLVSVQAILDQYVRFRQDWETAHMTPFLRMIVDRQIALRDESQRRLEAQADVPANQREAAVRRQAKLAELCELAATAFSGLAERTESIEPELSGVFLETAESLQSEELARVFEAAGTAISSGNWEQTVAQQTAAAEQLDGILTRLQEAQTEAARRALAGLQDRADSDLAAQAELEKLKAGYEEDLLDEPDGLKLTDIIHMAEVAQGKKGEGEDGEGYKNDYLFPDSAVPSLQQPDSGKRQEFDILKLATAPGKTPSFPSQSDRQGNRVKPHIQEEFEDLVGDLLEEEDEMQANYESFNLNAAFNINEPGEIGKQGGDLNSTAAAAATGNQKPPTTNVGGASRVGRQGARAHGAAVGNESINRRGRDKVQEGQERSPDQAGSVKETKSHDPQKDTSTGVGGRKVESDEAKFSQSDAGEFDEETIGKMDKAKDTHFMVERAGKKIDAEVAEMMKDMTSKQEQTLERLKSIRKDLKNLYLPTEHLDELIDKMQANLTSLNERPSVEVFRLQQETLDQVRGALQVFHQAHTGFQASLPREQVVRGRVLDDPARAAPPGYEEAVRNYYSKLTAP